MALPVWILCWEAMLVYGVDLLASPADAALTLVMLMLGLGAGYYGLLGRYWQSVCWMIGFAWYVRSFARYLAAVDPILASAPEPLPFLIILLYVPMLPPAWMLSIAATEALVWYRRWRGDEE